MTTAPPDPSAKLVTGGGNVDQVWLRWFRQIWRNVADLMTDVTALQSERAVLDQPWVFSTLIQTPSDTDYAFPLLGVPGTLQSVTTVTASGTCTVTVSIDGAALAGDSNSASSTEETVFHDIGNEMADESDITITVSSNSSAADLVVTLRGRQTLGAT